jgi:glycosyltransferase involved in cell wall biosynthesis
LIRGDGTLCDGRVSPETCQRCLLHDERPYRMLRSILGERLSKPVVRWISRTPVLSRQPGFLGAAVDVEKRQALLSQRLPYITHLISPSQYVADQCRMDGLTGEILLSRHGMKLDWLENYQRTPAPPGQIRLGYLGQINALKGVDVLIREYIGGDFGDGMTLTLHGRLDQSPGYAAHVQEMAEGNPHIRFAGPYLHPQLGQLMSEIDALVVPSVWPENAPLVVQEAFAAKIPVIASNMGGLPEFVHHGENGLLFDPHQEGSLLAQLRRLRQEGTPLLERLRAGIPQVLTIAEESQHLLELYRQAIAARAAQ